ILSKQPVQLPNSECRSTKHPHCHPRTWTREASFRLDRRDTSLRRYFYISNIFVSFGIQTGVYDEVYRHVKGLSAVLNLARVSHHIGFVSRVAEWQYLTILGSD